MKKTIIFAACFIAGLATIFAACNQPSAAPVTPSIDSLATNKQFGGFESKVKWGEHLVTIGGCNDCHTPKKIGANGPENDSSLLLSGHPEKQPLPDIDRKMAEAKGIAITNTETAWVGPWGVSYAANLTSDATGIGNWKEEQFIKALREGKWMGLENTRRILPPMPWDDIRLMTDDELKAVFAYLKSTKPIHNVQPTAQPPLTTMK